MSITAINTESDYDAALARLTVLLDAANDTTHGEELSALAALIEAYEEKYYPIDAPTKALLDAAQRDYNAHPDAGSPWSEVEARLRNRPR